MDNWCQHNSLWLITLVFSYCIWTRVFFFLISWMNPCNDAATNIIWVENWVSLYASETVLVRESWEKCPWEQAYVEISHIHSDNYILCLVNYVWTVTTNIKINIYMELENSIRTQEHNEKLKPSYIWQELLWFTPPCIVQIMVLITYLYGRFLSSILYG